MWGAPTARFAPGRGGARWARAGRPSSCCARVVQSCGAGFFADAQGLSTCKACNTSCGAGKYRCGWQPPPPGQAGACSGCQPLRRCACRAGCAVDQPGVCTSCQGQGQSFPCMACMQPADVVEGIALGCCSMPSRALSSRLWGPERRPGTHHHRHRITSHPITHHHTASHPITNALRGLTRWPSALQCSVSRAAHASRDNAAKIAAGLTPVSARSVDAAMPALAQNDTRLPPLPSRGLLVVQACAAGTVQPSVAFVTACTPCPEGQSQPQPQQTSCTVCGINTYQDQPGQSSCLGCASCLPGTILVGCGGASNGTCTACGS